jgi:hypothetical protein
MLTNYKQIVIAGGSGFIGRALAAELVAHHFPVVILTRHPRERADGIREIAWDGKTPGAWVQQLEYARAVINLTGKNVNCPHTPENLNAIITSRVDSVNALAAGITLCKNPPKAWIQASAVGYYGDSGDRICDENAPAGQVPLADICWQWEAAFEAAALPPTRKVILRLGFVLGRDGGGLPLLRRLTKYFLGGSAGTGRQYVSWVHIADLVEMFIVAIGRDNLRGVLNAVTPTPVTNAEFMAELRKALRRPWCPNAPEFAVRLGSRLLESEPTLALMGQRVQPAKFLEMEFRYRYPELRAALENLCGKKTASQPRDKKDAVRFN